MMACPDHSVDHRSCRAFNSRSRSLAGIGGTLYPSAVNAAASRPSISFASSSSYSAYRTRHAAAHSATCWSVSRGVPVSNSTRAVLGLDPVVAPEELLTHVTTVNGERPKALIRAEIVYFETIGDGAVFSTGSITFCGSLSHNNYENNVSRMLENVLRRFRA